MNAGSIAIELQGVEYVLPSLGGVSSSPRLDGGVIFAVSIKMIHYEDVLVVRRLFDRELASLIQVGFMEGAYLYDHVNDVIGLGVVRFLIWSCVIFRRRRGSLCRTDVFLLLIQMSLCCSNALREVFIYQLGGHVGP